MNIEEIKEYVKNKHEGQKRKARDTILFSSICCSRNAKK